MAFVIEICTSNNGRTLFPPMAGMLRSRFSFNKVRQNKHESMNRIQEEAPEIPGMHLLLDLKLRKFVAYDPLGADPAGRKLWSKIKPIFDKYPQNFDNFTPCESTTRENLGADDTKLLLHWMRRLIDAEVAVYGRDTNGVESEKLPTREEIAAMPGKRRVSPQSHRIFKDEKDGWTDVVEPKELAAAGSGGGGGGGGGNQNRGNGGNRQ